MAVKAPYDYLYRLYNIEIARLLIKNENDVVIYIIGRKLYSLVVRESSLTRRYFKCLNLVWLTVAPSPVSE